MSVAGPYALTPSTGSGRAGERQHEGMDRLLSYGISADQAFSAAIEADPGVALAHAGRALFALFQGDGATAKTAVEHARKLAAGATRRERQHVEALATIAG